MNKLFFLLIIVISVSACRREDSPRSRRTTVNARVLDETTGDTLTNINLFLIKTPSDNPGTLIPVEQYYIDSTGITSFTFTPDEEYDHYIFAVQGNLILRNYVYIQTGRTNDLNVFLVHPSFVEIHIVNSNPLDSADLLSVYDSDYYNPEHLLYGTSVDTFITVTHYSNSNNLLKWKVTRNDSTSSYNQVFTLPPGDTLQFDLFY